MIEGPHGHSGENSSHWGKDIQQGNSLKINSFEGIATKKHEKHSGNSWGNNS